MALTKFSTDVGNIATLTDRPNQNEGLSSTQLKGRFDKAGTDIKTYINDTLTAELGATTDGSSGADNIGLTALKVGGSTTVQGGLEELKADTSAALTAHTSRTDNPHTVTKTQVGLGNVDNTSDATKNSAVATLTNKTLTTPKINEDVALTVSATELNFVDGVTSAIQPQIEGKVDKVTGKGLSTNDYDNTEKANVASNTTARHTHTNKATLDTYTQTEANLADAVSKKHSHTNKATLDTYTQTEANLADAVTKKHSHANKAVLDIISDVTTVLGSSTTKVPSEKAVADAISSAGGGDMLKATYDPTNINASAFDVDNHVSGSTNKVYTATEQAKLGGIEDGAEVNVNADWDAESGDAQILNKPFIPDDASDIAYDNTTSGLTADNAQDAIDELSAEIADLDLSADNVTYDNTTSGLSADDVQGAIDEIVGLSPIANVSNFTVSDGYTSLNLTWTNPSSLVNVILFYSTSDITNFTYANCVSNATQIYSGTGTSYDHTGLSMSTTYYYKIFVEFDHFGTKYSTGVALTKTTGSLPAPGNPLSTYSWADINTISQAGVASTYWSVGDEKNIAVNGETLTMRIYGFNHDTLSSDGTTKAGITFGMKHLMASTRQMNSSNTNSGGWTSSAMRSWITGTLIGQMPSDLQSVLKTVNKLTSAGSTSSTINTIQDKVFLFSEIEIFGSITYSKAGEGSKYSIFSDNASRIKKLSNGSGSAYVWWERSPCGSNSTGFCRVHDSGSADDGSAGYSYGVAFGFCV